MKLLVLIPHYNHAGTLGSVVSAMCDKGYPVLVVDDASAEGCAGVLQAMEQTEGVSVVHRSRNGGKGAAVKDGIRFAARQGYTHILQVDADAQHRLEDAGKLLEAAQARPDAIVCAEPEYGDDAPKSRLYGRKITLFWTTVNTGTRQIKDAMVGFRIYPVDSVLPLIDGIRTADRMEFDIEILVRAVWGRIPLLWVKTPVAYREGGISHFRMWSDNGLIARMHARLFFVMLGRRLKTLTGVFRQHG